MMELVNAWKEALLSPNKALKSQKGKADLAKALKNVLVSGLIAGILQGIASYDAVIFLLTVIAYPILTVIGLLITSGVYYVFARLLGGKGSYTVQTYMISIFTAPMTVVISFVLLIAMLETLSLLMLPVLVILTLYSVYLSIIALREAHGYSTLKAFVTWLIPLVIVMIFVILAAAFLYTIFAEDLATGFV